MEKKSAQEMLNQMGDSLRSLRERFSDLDFVLEEVMEADVINRDRVGNILMGWQQLNGMRVDQLMSLIDELFFVVQEMDRKCKISSAQSDIYKTTITQ